MVDVGIIRQYGEGLFTETGTTFVKTIEEPAAAFADDEDWLFVSTAHISGSDTAQPTVQYRTLYPDGSIHQWMDDWEPTGNFSWHGHMKRIADLGPTPGDLEQQIAETGTQTADAKKCQLFGIRLSDLAAGDFAYAEDATDYTHTLTHVTHSSISPSQVAGEKWVIMASVICEQNQANFSIEYRITKDGVEIAMGICENEDVAATGGFFLIVGDDDVSTESPTYAIQVRDDAAGTKSHTIFSSIFAMRLDAYESFSMARSVAHAFSAADVYETAATFTHTPTTTGDHVVIGAYVGNPNDQPNRVKGKVVFAGTTDSDKVSSFPSYYDDGDQYPDQIFQIDNITTAGKLIDLDIMADLLTAPAPDVVEPTLIVFSKKLAVAAVAVYPPFPRRQLTTVRM